MRDGVTLQRRLSLTGRKDRMIPDLDSVFVVNLIKPMNKQSWKQKYETPLNAHVAFM